LSSVSVRTAASICTTGGIGERASASSVRHVQPRDLGKKREVHLVDGVAVRDAVLDAQS
jgi:hypothetical protein